MQTKNIPLDAINDLLTYEPSTGLLFWKARPLKYFPDVRAWKIWNTKYANKQAGNIRKRKDGYSYRQISIFNNSFMAHRVAWAIMTGDQPPDEIDHINMDATDCRWSNLRDGTGINQRNKTMLKNNTSGFVGVSKHSLCKNRYAAKGFVDGKYHHLGMFDSAESAYEAVLDFKRKNGFSENHGMKKKPYLSESM